MKTFPEVLAACVFVALCGYNLQAQQTATSTGGFLVSIDTGTFGPTPVVGEPYSAVEENETKQTLSDGTNIEQHNTNRKTYRDSQGRTRIETYVQNVPGEPDPSIPINISVQDPVAGTIFFLDPHNHTAHEIAPPAKLAARVPPSQTVAPQPPIQPPPEPPNVTREDLGTQMMEGLLVQGTRTTITIPTGAQGNDRPMQVVTETWHSADLKIDVLRTTSDPRTGVRTERLTQISRSEPALSLFEIPPDYTIDQPHQ